MTNALQVIWLHIFFLLIFVNGCTNKKKAEQPQNNPIEQAVLNDDPDCVQFVALWAAGDIAEKIGKDKKWVFRNYTVDLWDSPPTYESGIVVGKLRASSYARIISTMGNDYKVESPGGKVQGWISSEHVKTISIKNPKTNKLCD